MSLQAYAHDHVAPSQEGAATLVMLHGTGGDRHSFARLAGMIAPSAGVLSLDGDVSEMGAKRFFRRRAEGVYDMDDLAQRTDALGRFLEAAFATYGIAPSTAVGVGYSNGANILANLALTGAFRPRKLALMHPLIPHRPDPLPDLSGDQILITAGRRDPFCPPDLTERLERLLVDAGASPRTAWFDGGHEVSAGEIEALKRFLA